MGYYLFVSVWYLSVPSAVLAYEILSFCLNVIFRYQAAICISPVLAAGSCYCQCRSMHLAQSFQNGQKTCSLTSTEKNVFYINKTIAENNDRTMTYTVGAIRLTRADWFLKKFGSKIVPHLKFILLKKCLAKKAENFISISKIHARKN
jgi:hypothetical protein